MWRAEDILGLFGRSQKQTSQELVDDGVQRTCIVRASVFAASMARRFKLVMNSCGKNTLAVFAVIACLLSPFLLLSLAHLLCWFSCPPWLLVSLAILAALVPMASLVTLASLASSGSLAPWVSLASLAPSTCLNFQVSLASYFLWLSWFPWLHWLPWPPWLHWFH